MPIVVVTTPRGETRDVDEVRWPHVDAQVIGESTGRRNLPGCLADEAPTPADGSKSRKHNHVTLPPP